MSLWKRRDWIRRIASAVFASSAVARLSLSGEDPDTADPWQPDRLMQPEQLRDRLARGERPSIFYVGFPVLYRGAHVTGAVLTGPCSKPEGLAALHQRLRKVPHDQEIVLYCGCCPFVKCPNIRPAYSASQAAGFKRVKVLFLATNLHTDWTAKGYPIERGRAS